MASFLLLTTVGFENLIHSMSEGLILGPGHVVLIYVAWADGDLPRCLVLDKVRWFLSTSLVFVIVHRAIRNRRRGDVEITIILTL